MKIRGKLDELQNEALKLLEPKTKKATSDPAKVAGQAMPTISDEVTIDVSLSNSIGTALDPVAMEAEHRAKFEALKKQVQSGTYVMPASTEIAKKLSDEIEVEIMSAGIFQDDDKV
jgi:anti-sigma28 factor (negative regulator of flagellin synthesis)